MPMAYMAYGVTHLKDVAQHASTLLQGSACYLHCVRARGLWHFNEGCIKPAAC